MRTEELTRPGYAPRRLLDRAADGRGRAVLPRVRPAQPRCPAGAAGGLLRPSPRRRPGRGVPCGRSRRPPTGWGPTARPTGGCSGRWSSTGATSSTSSSPASCAVRRPAACREVLKFALTGLPNVRWLARRYFDTEAGQALLAGAAAHGMLDLARPLTASLGMMLGMLAHHVGLAADRGRVAEAGRRDGRGARGAGRRGRHRARGHRPAGVRRRARGPARHHAAGVRGDGRRPGARGLPPLGVPLQARTRGLQGRLGAVRAGAVDQSRRPPSGNHPPRRHAGGDPRRRGGAGGRPADRQALRARGPAHRARPQPGARRAGTSSGPTCTCRTARTST